MKTTASREYTYAFLYMGVTREQNVSEPEKKRNRQEKDKYLLRP